MYIACFYPIAMCKRVRNLDPSAHKHADCIANDQRKANDHANPSPYSVCGTFGFAKCKP